MFDYRMHYALMAAEDRLRPPRHDAIRGRNAVRRVFRIGPAHAKPRQAGRG